MKISPAWRVRGLSKKTKKINQTRYFPFLSFSSLFLSFVFSAFICTNSHRQPQILHEMVTRTKSEKMANFQVFGASRHLHRRQEKIITRNPWSESGRRRVFRSISARGGILRSFAGIPGRIFAVEYPSAFHQGGDCSRAGMLMEVHGSRHEILPGPVCDTAAAVASVCMHAF